MQFGATPEQDMIVETVRSFVEQEIYPLEDKIEKLGFVPKDIADDINGFDKDDKDSVDAAPATPQSFTRGNGEVFRAHIFRWI